MVAEDATARAFYRRQRRRQLALIAALRSARGRARRRAREDDAVLLYTLERVCDAIAEGELRDLGLAVAPTLDGCALSSSGASGSRRPSPMRWNPVAESSPDSRDSRPDSEGLSSFADDG